MNGQERTAGGRIVRGLIVVIIGLIIWFSPVPAGVKERGVASSSHLCGHHRRVDSHPLAPGSHRDYRGHDDRLTEILKIGPCSRGLPIIRSG